MALHEQSVGATNEWYTPPHVFDAMAATFDMDVASPGADVVPWIPAREVITSRSMESDWRGFIWMNPPFGGRNALVPWMEKFVTHGNGICLVPDRTSAPWWQDFARYMDMILFVSPKLKFIGADGKPGASPAQGTCLMALGSKGRWALRRASVAGLGYLAMPAIDRRSSK